MNVSFTSAAAIALTNNLAVFNRPVWVTEFSDYHATSDAEEKLYMQEVVSAYENNPDVFRYSWFTGRRDDAPRINIYGNSGVLTDLGAAYSGASYISKKITVPGRVAANKHYRRKGTGLENTTDAGTVQNVCYIDAGDWAEFMLNVPNPGTYGMTFRVASQAAAGKFDIQVNGTTIKSDISFTATGGWQTWKDVPGYEGLYKVSPIGEVKSIDRLLNRGGFIVMKKGKLLISSSISTRCILL